MKGVTMYSQGSLWLRGLARGLGFLLVAAMWAFPATNASAEGEGEARALQGQAMFGQRCAVCHTIGGGVLIGPDLQGVTERRAESWLRVHIQSPSIQRAENDPIAKALLEQFRVPMPDLGLTEQQVEAVTAYLKTTQRAPVAKPALYIPTLAMGALAIVVFTLIGLVVGTKRVEVGP
jgi:mono/diheme cytochrome c family protein